jgi:hypothetical protein
MKKSRSFFHKAWDLAFVKGGMDALFADGPFEVDVVKNPFKDRWFADPFVLDVTDDKIYVLAEEFCYSLNKGRVAKLTIDRHSMTIERFDILLECPTHISFPNILRRDGKVYVYPESCNSGKLDLYEYDLEHEKLTSPRKICNDAVWDASMTDVLGKLQLFAGCQSDYYLDVYDWNDEVNMFVPVQSIKSNQKDNRMAGQLFVYKGEVYCPTQDCTQGYGGGVWLKKVLRDGENLKLEPIKKLVPPAGLKKLGMHTLNEYKGMVIIDLRDWVYPIAGKIYNLYKSLSGKK